MQKYKSPLDNFDMVPTLVSSTSDFWQLYKNILMESLDRLIYFGLFVVPYNSSAMFYFGTS